MPSTIIGSSTWNTRGIVLTSQSAQEQVNGLVNVQVEYTVPATKQQKIDQMFYVDAPPPIWPSVVNRSEMLTNNIYMVTRNVERANGLVRVRAEYVSGLKRAGFRGYFLRETVETGKRGVAFNYFTGQEIPGLTVVRALVVTPAPSKLLRATTFSTGFIYDERIKTVEFVRIGGQNAATLPLFTRADMASVLQATQSGIFRGFGVDAALLSDAPDNVEQADLWRALGTDEAYASGLSSFEKTTPIPYLESWDYVTPNVQIVTLTYRLTR